MTSKLNAVLDEKTLINFKFIFKLLKRYKFISALVPLIVVCLMGYLYKTQNQIHSGSISFTFISERSGQESPAAMTVLLGNSAKSTGKDEVMAIVNSTNFLQALAVDIHSDPELSKFNFNGIFSKSNASFKHYVAHCKSKECEIDFLRRQLSGFFSVLNDGLIKSKFNLIVKTLNRFTTDKLIYYIANNIERFRLKTLNYQLQHKIEITKKLLKKQREKAVSEHVLKVMSERSILKSEHTALEEKYFFYEKILNEKKVLLEQEGISLKYTNNTIKRKISSTEKAQWGKAKKLKLKKELLLADISALEHTVGDKSVQDNSVIINLKKELKKIDNELISVNSSKSLFLLDKFKSSKRQNKDLIEFNISVLKDQIKQLEHKTEGLNQDKIDLIRLMNSKEEFINKNKSSLEYLKLLETKLQQVMLMKDSVVSDIEFDNYLSMTKRYKKYSLMAFLPFSVILALSLTIFLLIIRYYFDPRLLDQEEFEVVFEGVSYIGEVPEFE